MDSAQGHDQGSSSKLVLYSYWQSSCSWRIRFALNLKGLPYEYRAVNLPKGEQFTAEFARLNPLNYVPVLIDGDVVVSDSFAIFLYLEERYPQKPLLPMDPQLRALNLQVASMVASSIQPLIMQSILRDLAERVGQQESLSWARLNIGKGFRAIENLLSTYGDCRYATGEEIYMADVFLVPQVNVAATRFRIDMSKFPNLSRVYESCHSLPEFQASLPERQPDAVA